MIRGAGILFVTLDDRALFLKRGLGGDWPLYWCFPGGTQEEGETAEQCAERETIEELGFLPTYLPKGEKQKIATTITPRSKEPDAEEVQFTTYRQHVADTFEPKLNGEHLGFAWAPVNHPPEPMHPGCKIALEKLTWNELDIARAIRDGILASPHQYENMWLFAMRITGTGTAFRRKLDEHVLRRPKYYLSDDFLERCNGLPVIVEHPNSAKLDSKEYAERNVGSIMLPYVKGDEVWGVARIYDESAADMLSKHQFSTSPSVVLKRGENLKVGLEDGKTLLVEGEPHLLDHLAICEVGVWDKGNDPAGIEVHAIGDSQMPPEKTKEDVKADAEVDLATEPGTGPVDGQMLDKVLAKLDACITKMDSLGSRMDAIDGGEGEGEEEEHHDAEGEEGDEEEHHDAEGEGEEEHEREDEMAEQPNEEGDETREDEPEGEDEHEREDAMADSDDDVRRAIAALNKQLPKIVNMLPAQMSDTDYRALADAQERAESVFVAFGDHAPFPMRNETVNAYRKRLASKLKKHSNNWKGIDLYVVNDDGAFGIAENQIYADAMSAANAPDTVPDGQLRMVSRVMPSGHRENTFVGSPHAWMNRFASTRRYVTKINPKPEG